ncbi:PEGA domain-containing protein [Chitinispirillales bacterium ANBcel5]|uniref:PEGA domain-containing protein n=1 Tax=Cellulosispirillum alkaliphilum TaxID=3039283 RepID=UPI002A4F1A33|nr:PEGA domain-containing protein [Chitinispirillales bacterium ANBcel5]
MRVLGLIVLTLYCSAIASDSECPEDSKPLLFTTYLYPENIINESLLKELFEELYSSLREIGYCLIEMDHWYEESSTERNDSEQLTLLLSIIENEADLDTKEPLLLASISQKPPESRSEIKEMVANPLISFSVSREDLFATQSIIARKIKENLRNQYLYHIRIYSSPEGVNIQGPGGIEGITPLELVRPIGRFSIEASKEGYQTLCKDLFFEDGGTHSIYLQLNKRRFYHSKYFYVAALSALSSVVFYTLENHYHQQYLSLGREDYFERPERFDTLFKRAQTFERLAVSSLILSGVSLGLSFAF